MVASILCLVLSKYKIDYSIYHGIYENLYFDDVSTTGCQKKTPNQKIIHNVPVTKLFVKIFCTKNPRMYVNLSSKFGELL